jgi:hypothetical protein
MPPERRYIGPKIYVEQQDEGGMLVSWTWGHRRAESPDEFFALLDQAVQETYHPKAYPVVTRR